MKISKRCEYALRALIELSRTPGHLMTIPKISQAQGIPPKFLEQILLTLRQGKMLTSRRGAGGGYCLERVPGQITLWEVFRIMKGEVAGLKEAPAPRPGDPVDLFFSKMDREMEQKLRTTTLEDLLQAAASDPTPHFDI
jgi:Rrf2 family protein